MQRSTRTTIRPKSRSATSNSLAYGSSLTSFTAIGTIPSRREPDHDLYMLCLRAFCKQPISRRKAASRVLSACGPREWTYPSPRRSPQARCCRCDGCSFAAAITQKVDRTFGGPPALGSPALHRPCRRLAQPRKGQRPESSHANGTQLKTCGRPWRRGCFPPVRGVRHAFCPQNPSKCRSGLEGGKYRLTDIRGAEVG